MGNIGPEAAREPIGFWWKVKGSTGILLAKEEQTTDIEATMVGSGSCTVQSTVVNLFIKDFSEVVYSSCYDEIYRSPSINGGPSTVRRGV